MFFLFFIQAKVYQAKMYIQDVVCLFVRRSTCIW